MLRSISFEKLIFSPSRRNWKYTFGSSLRVIQFLIFLSKRHTPPPSISKATSVIGFFARWFRTSIYVVIRPSGSEYTSLPNICFAKYFVWSDNILRVLQGYSHRDPLTASFITNGADETYCTSLTKHISNYEYYFTLTLLCSRLSTAPNQNPNVIKCSAKYTWRKFWLTAIRSLG